MARRFEIEDTISRQYSRFSAKGPQLVVRLLPPADSTDPVNHFLASLNDLFRHALQNLSASDLVGITIQNRENQNDNPKGISFRRKEQVARGVILSLIQRVSQSYSRFVVLDKLINPVDSVSVVELKARAVRSQS
jgi:hypothetical protein